MYIIYKNNSINCEQNIYYCHYFPKLLYWKQNKRVRQGRGECPASNFLLERRRYMENAARESYNLYINGQWVDASDGGTFKSYCPANG